MFLVVEWNKIVGGRNFWGEAKNLGKWSVNRKFEKLEVEVNSRNRRALKLDISVKKGNWDDWLEIRTSKSSAWNSIKTGWFCEWRDQNEEGKIQWVGK